MSDDEERRTRRVAFDYATDRPRAATSRPEAAVEQPPVSSASPPARPSSRPGLANARLTRLLDRTSAWPLVGLFGLAACLGAIHAIQPGHGKTLVAASVLDERGRGSAASSWRS